ncbi:DMT family transporter [Candidatus Cytomitobacter indipagum]|nr:DMT family transporter [Candidatus Cytomitobacter indipagum]
MIKNNSLNYLKASSWFVMSILCGFFNDYIVKYISVSDFIDVSIFQMNFLRFFFSAIILLPFFILKRYKKSKSNSNNAKISLDNSKNWFKKYRILEHSIRSVLLFIPMILWTYGIAKGSLVFSTFMEFSIPLFVLIIARISLKESLKGRFSSTLIGIFGILIVAKQYVNLISLPIVLCIASAAFLFALSDVINKYLLNDDEEIINLLFFTSVGVSIISFPFAFKLWQCIAFNQLFLYILQGLLGNCLFLFILKSYKLADVASLQPLRFLSLPISMFLSSRLGDALCFKSIFIGMILLIISLIYSMFYEICINK